MYSGIRSLKRAYRQSGWRCYGQGTAYPVEKKRKICIKVDGRVTQPGTSTLREESRGSCTPGQRCSLRFLFRWALPNGLLTLPHSGIGRCRFIFTISCSVGYFQLHFWHESMVFVECRAPISCRQNSTSGGGTYYLLQMFMNDLILVWKLFHSVIRGNGDLPQPCCCKYRHCLMPGTMLQIRWNH